MLYYLALFQRVCLSTRECGFLNRCFSFEGLKLKPKGFTWIWFGLLVSFLSLEERKGKRSRKDEK